MREGAGGALSGVAGRLVEAVTADGPKRFPGSGQVGPPRKVRSCLAGVLAQDGGCVVLGIHGDADQMDIISGWVAGEPFLQLNHHGCLGRAALGAASENE